ncbi:uncharacterized protein LOC106095877 isoform X2 [Stomoxys calcitrans]|uniref:uncharacterized protein LOC106095877 isoform X2 n=1 Tax=Stomoxys calcitrans TaxID=35570 RepID=UPI0027E26EAF|nr:uncharacterized protein LOC106095877 isoform X2 [Stomoxys calcitrans]
MMYIENTGLEDNLHHILTNRIPTSSSPSAAAAASALLLAHVREAAHNSASSQVPRVEEQHKPCNKEWVRRPEPQLVPVESLQTLDVAKRLPSIPKEALNGELKNLAKNKEEEEPEEEFELLYVEDIDLPESEANTSKLRSETEEQPNESENKNRSTTHFVIDLNKFTGPASSTAAEEEEEYEYVVTRVAKKKSNRLPPTSLQESYQTTNSQPNLLHSQKFKRPVPEAIPIEIHRRKLVGDITASSSRDYSAVNGFEGPDCSYYSDLETAAAVSDRDCDTEVYNKDVQMGLDILNKIKQIFNWNPLPSQTDIASQEGKRKRSSFFRSEDYSGESASDHLIKYRKVENRFPKYVSHTEDDDVMHIAAPTPLKSNSFISNNMSSGRRSGIDKPALRKSMFSAPTITKQVIRNTSYADFEFSDEDEPQLVYPSTSRGVRHSPNTFNIPIMHSEEFTKSSTQRPQPPPLIEVETARRSSYADALRQSNARVPISMAGRQGHLLGARNNSVSSSGEAASMSHSSRLINGLSSLRTNPNVTRSSILAQEKESEERDKYQKLLEQVMPRLYSSSNENKISTLTQQRRRSNILLAAATSSTRSSPANNRRSLGLSQSITKRPPLSSTINLDDDDDDDVSFNGIKPTPRLTKGKSSVPTTIVLDDDDDISDIVDLENTDRHVLSQCAKLKQEQNSLNILGANKAVPPKKKALPYVEPVNSFKERISACPHVKENWLESFQSKWSQRKRNILDEVKETVKVADKLTLERRAAEAEIQERLRKFQIVDPDLLVVDDFEDVLEPEFVELTQQHVERINAAIRGPLDTVLVSKFNLNITRRDIHTLCGHNWLNDEVINFYMNLLTERGELKSKSHGLPTVYAMNTFFVPRLIQAGHAGVKRWTRKVDIFSKDILPVPVHVGGVHWCMAIIHMKNRSIKYYDSMGTPNPTVLKALEQYLKDESLDKRKQPFDTSDFVIESVQGVPRQMNGSDCGVFSCMFAEYITRNKDITFSQQNMEYFRQKMVLEIVNGELLQ